MDQMPPLRHATRGYIAGLVTLVVIALVIWLPETHPLGIQHSLLALATSGTIAATLLFPLPFAWKTRLHLDTTVILAATLIFEPAVAVVIVASGSALAQAIRRERWAQAVFNGAQRSLQAVASSGILLLAGWDPIAPTFNRVETLVSVIAAGVVVHVINTAAVAVMIGVEERLSSLRVWHESTSGFDLAETLSHFGQVGVALLAAVIADAHMWALGLLLLPVIAMYGSLTHLSTVRRSVEERLQGAEASLTEAQRLASLGSWEWNLETGHRLWSREARRILGAPLDVQAYARDRDLLIEAVHPDDAAALEVVLGRALRGTSPASIDHRIVRDDGIVRHVHSRIEVVFDASGAPSRVLGALHDITDRKQLEERLAFQAFHDALTGLPNRALFTDRLNHALTRSRRQAGRLAILFLDLDHFKLVNDTLGHEAGDQLLITVADRVRSCVRPGDTVARIGGDEFTILLEELTSPFEAEQIAERITTLLAEPFSIGNQDFFVTASIGIVLQDEQHRTPDDLLRAADVALYRAKDAGRARFAIYDDSMGEAMRERVRLESDLRRALDRGELELHYQPHHDMTTRAIVGVEAFIRWPHPERGAVCPAQFIPIAEETGLINTLDLWVLEEACRQGQAWQATHGSPLTISVNLSGKQLRRPELAGIIACVLRNTGLPASALKLEISEIDAMADAETTAGTMDQLMELGVQVVIDDFGTGYSSLIHLKRFPIDTLKLDGSIVSGLGRDVEATEIARAVIGLAHSLGIRVVAEGIEREEQFRELQALGCEYGQGNYFSAPLATNAMTLLLSGVSISPSDPRSLDELSLLRAG